MIRSILFVIVFCTGISTHAQTVLEWSDLSKGISWETPILQKGIPGFQRAFFSPDMKALEGKYVTIIGYFLILDGKQSVYMLSANPMASCFFCGNGGPETVVDLKFARKPNHRMDDLISVEGILRLNEDDPNSSYYKIEDVRAFSFR